MDNERYMKIRKAIEKSLELNGYVLNFFETVDINSISEPGKTRVTFELKDAKEPTPPTPPTIIYYYKYFDTNTDDYIVAEFPSASDKNAIKHFKFIIENNTDKARWNMMELYRYDEDIKIVLYSCDKHKPDYQKIDEINAKLRNMK